jgi:glycolate oxidase FAD binding subunit
MARRRHWEFCEIGEINSMSAATSDAWALTAGRIAERFGAANVIASAAGLAGYEVDEMRPAAAVFPKSPEEIADLLKFAAAEKLAVVPCGSRTKLGIGMPPTRYDIALDLSRMNRVLAYEPRDLTLGVEPGMKFPTLAMALASEKQFLPLNPPFMSRATVGGILAADSPSPLRHLYGGPRDFVLGLEFVTGDGVIAKSGGRVVKNVSGYDLHKLLIGSLGTLAVITRANFKTFPMPPEQVVFVVTFDHVAAALEFCRALGRSPLGALQVDVISPEAAQILSARAEVEIALPANRWGVVVSAAGNARVVERHRRELPAIATQAKANGLVSLGDTLQSVKVAAALLGRVREFPALALNANVAATIFRIAALPSTMTVIAQRLSALASENAMPSALVLRPHGLIYFAILPANDDAAPFAKLGKFTEAVFRAMNGLGAQARIEFAPTELKRAVNVWGAARPDFELMRRVKRVFDPGNVLSPRKIRGRHLSRCLKK